MHRRFPKGDSLGGLMANDIIADVRKRALARAAKVSTAMELNGKYQSQLYMEFYDFCSTKLIIWKSS